jgi:hypothetical protein
MKTPWQVMTGGDWLVILTLLGISIAGIVWLAAAPQGTRVVVTSGDQTCFVAELDQSHSVDLDGPLGKTHLVIDATGAHVTSSPCPRKVCISMGPVKHSGDLLACVPNRIMVRIEGPSDENTPYDLLSR